MDVSKGIKENENKQAQADGNNKWKKQRTSHKDEKKNWLVSP